MNEQLQTLINQSNKIVVFTGAGISTLSGIPDFRSCESMKIFGQPEEISNIKCLKNNPELFSTFFKKRIELMKDAEPNVVHNFIKELEDKGKLSMLVTQNIDNLHQKSGVKKIITLHGNAFSYNCMNCHKSHKNYNPKCECGGVVRPNIVLFGEELDFDAFLKAKEFIEDSDLLIVMGTSLSVSPACDICLVPTNGKKILVNDTKTGYEDYFDIVINERLENVFFEKVDLAKMFVRK